MADEALDKKHAATGKRMADMHKRGNMLRSRDLVSGLVFFISLLMLLYVANRLGYELKYNFDLIYLHVGDVLTHDFTLNFVYQCVSSIFFTLLPFFLAVLLTVLLSPFLLGGWNFTLEVLRFKFDKMNPFNNLANLVSKKTAINILTSVIKTSLIIAYLIAFIKYHLHTIVNIMHNNQAVALQTAASIAENFILGLGMILVLIMLMDSIYHYFEYHIKSMMTSQEVKEEHRESEGSPEAKRKLKSMQFAMFKQRLSNVIPQATVIVTNPTHYAIALRYDTKKDRAPRVIAKGKDHLALLIRKIGVQHAITIYESPPLARALYKTSKLNAEIRTELYVAVAIVLSYVQNLKLYQQGLGDYPVHATDLKIPSHFLFKD